MITQAKILITGGSGLLGGELKKVLPKAKFPTSTEFNVTNFSQMQRYLLKHKPEIIIHAAAATSPPAVEQNPIKALKTNIVGTSFLAELCFEQNIKMVYICTDYVYSGKKGNYTENDPVLPVNKYAWSKLGGECAVRMLENYLILRISLGAKVFPYERAFVDHITSRETADVIAKKIFILIKKGASGIYNLGSKGRSVYEFAKTLRNAKAVGKTSIKVVNFVVPPNTSFNTQKYKKFVKRK